MTPSRTTLDPHNYAILPPPIGFENDTTEKGLDLEQNVDEVSTEAGRSTGGSSESTPTPRSTTTETTRDSEMEPIESPMLIILSSNLGIKPLYQRENWISASTEEKCTEDSDESTENEESIKEIEESIKEMQESIKKSRESIKEHEESIKEMQESIKKSREKTKEHEESIKEHQESIKEHEERTRKIEERIKEHEDWLRELMEKWEKRGGVSNMIMKGSLRVVTWLYGVKYPT